MSSRAIGRSRSVLRFQEPPNCTASHPPCPGAGIEKHLAGRVGRKLLFESIPRCETLRVDLDRAGIPYKDAEGRQADLHAFRKAISTHMGANYAALRAQMGMMRYGDMKLTMSTYTDESHISFREAIEKVPNILDPKSLTHPLTHGIVVSSPNVSPDCRNGSIRRRVATPFYAS